MQKCVGLLTSAYYNIILFTNERTLTNIFRAAIGEKFLNMKRGIATLADSSQTMLTEQKMVCDILITGIPNDVACEKIIKKGPNVTLAQVL